MTPAAIIEAVQAEGVSLTLSTAGTIKATGDGAVVSRWLPTIREHKAGILAALRVGADTTVTLPLSAADERAIRAWLAIIGETDQAIIADTIARCRNDVEARNYFTGRAK
jgi:hypothetical protein